MAVGRGVCAGVVVLCAWWCSGAQVSAAVEPAELQVSAAVEPAQAPTTNNTMKHGIAIEGDQFVLDGRPLRIVSGSLHYFRAPAAYWRDRLHKLKAAGLNAVCTYVEWSYHEPEERQYQFEGDRDLVAFLQTAADLRLHVLLRPGPYICAERDLGGLPYWLLAKYPNIRLRSTDRDFINETEIWMDELFKRVKPLLLGNGGPIILVQVENEYGSYGNDMKYMEAVREMLSKHVGDAALLYTTDGWSRRLLEGGAVPGALTTVDFGPTANPALEMFAPLRRLEPRGPLMNSEYYTGWITHWRERLATVGTSAVLRTLTDMLDNHINLNFYMFFGGTNFEFTSGASVWPLGSSSQGRFPAQDVALGDEMGANYDGTYQPTITSYDYDSPLSEAGDPTPKYYAIRDALKNYEFLRTSAEPPPPAPKGNYGKVTVSAQLDLLAPAGRAALGHKHEDVAGAALPTFESLRQRGGFVLYETVLETEQEGLLEIQKPRDLISVYVDGELRGQINRMIKLYSLPLKTSRNGSLLSLLVENQGRINYGLQLHDYKGILSEVILNNKVLNGSWKVTGFPLEVVDVRSRSAHVSCPALFEGQFSLPEGQAPLDTFLDTSGWNKGLVWINGHNLGRYWPEVGPQVTLYVPGVWLRAPPHTNRLQVLELQQPRDDLSLHFIDHPILNRTNYAHQWITS